MSRVLISLLACSLAIYVNTNAARADPDVIQVSLKGTPVPKPSL